MRGGRATSVLAALLLGATAAAQSRPAEPAAEPARPKIRALLLTGAHNHDWRWTSRELKALLEGSGRFVVELRTDPAKALVEDAPRGRDLILLDYNGPRFGPAAEARLLAAVRRGTGLVVLHAANNAFPDWKAYAGMIGLVWRNGRSGHGRFHRFDLRALRPRHPILAGLPPIRGHPDELYHGLQNPAESGFEVLADAFSEPERGGSGKREPMVLVRREGEGRIFHCVLGHVWKGRPETRESWFDEGFRLLVLRGAEWAATGRAEIESVANLLTPGEREEGWRSLFDGTGTGAWRGFRRKGFPAKGWVVRDGMLVHEAGAGGGDLVTREVFGDFDLRLEWRVAKGGNSGIFYRVTEEAGAVWMTGPEMQVLDDAGHGDGRNPLTSAGALYGLLPCAVPAVRPAGSWNRVRILLRGGKVEHWLNGRRVVSLDLGSPRFAALVAKSKFRRFEGFGKAERGHLALQDHGDEVAFRGIKIRVLGNGRGKR